MSEVISDKGQSEPYILIVGSMEEPAQAFLVVDQEILLEFEVCDSALAIVSVFFVFNICYTKGLINVFSFLETIIFDLKNKLPLSVSNFISVLTQ